MTFSVSEVAAAANKVGKKVNKITSIKIGKKGPSGRAMTIVINGIEVPAPELRLALGSERLKSTFIDSIILSGNNIIIKGRGFGHGVGMSQYGAVGLAEQGGKAEDIISHYFKGIKLEKRW